MRKLRFRSLLGLVSVFAIVAAACGGNEPTTTGPAAEGTVCVSNTTSGDLLADICDKGVITNSTDPAYPPQSSLNEQTGEYEGFDIDVATEIANRLGVSIEFTDPSFDLITAGNWNGRWDMAVGSITVLPTREEVLFFTVPYYYTPAGVAVHEDNTSVQDVTTDLDGKKIGACSSCSYDFYLQQTLSAPGVTYEFVIDDAQIITYDTDTTAIQDLSLGDGARLDAAVSATPTLQGAIDEGAPIKIVDGELFYEALAVGFDRSSGLDSQSLADAVNGIIEEMHSDGTLKSLSEKWYDGADISVLPAGQ